MKSNKKALNRLAILLFGGVALSSCAVGNPNKSEYITTIKGIFSSTKTEVKILQMTDIHWSFGTDMKKQSKYLKKLVEKADPDIIVTTGDNILAGNARNYQKLFETLNSFKNSSGKPIYWTTVWGNHDRQGSYNPDYPSNLAKNYSKKSVYDYDLYNGKNKGLYKCPKDNVQGRSNYLINLTNESDEVVWRIWGIDSNSDHFNGMRYVYDCIHDDQIKWFKEMAADNDKPGLAFFHIPLFQSLYSYDLSHDGLNTIAEGDFGGEIREDDWGASPLNGEEHIKTGVYVGYKDTGFFKAAKDNHVKGMFYGHDHVNDFWALYDDQAKNGTNPNGTDDDVLLAYGTKTGAELYYDKALIGGNLITIHADGSFNGRRKDFDTGGHVTDFEQVLLSYEEAGL